MIQLFSQPYDSSASGFHFTKASEYAMASMNNRNASGAIVEEYEIQFIDGEDIDCELAKAWGLNQGNFSQFLAKAEEWEEWEKVAYIIAVGECSYDHDTVVDDPSSIDVVTNEASSMRELAEQFVDEGIFGDIPDHLQNYIDYDAIARDLSHDGYCATTIAGNQFIYRCA